MSGQGSAYLILTRYRQACCGYGDISGATKELEQAVSHVSFIIELTDLLIGENTPEQMRQQICVILGPVLHAHILEIVDANKHLHIACNFVMAVRSLEFSLISLLEKSVGLIYCSLNYDWPDLFVAIAQRSTLNDLESARLVVSLFCLFAREDMDYPVEFLDSVVGCLPLLFQSPERSDAVVACQGTADVLTVLSQPYPPKFSDLFTGVLEVLGRAFGEFWQREIDPLTRAYGKILQIVPPVLDLTALSGMIVHWCVQVPVFGSYLVRKLWKNHQRSEVLRRVTPDLVKLLLNAASWNVDPGKLHTLEGARDIAKAVRYVDCSAVGLVLDAMASAITCQDQFVCLCLVREFLARHGHIVRARFSEFCSFAMRAASVGLVALVLEALDAVAEGVKLLKVFDDVLLDWAGYWLLVGAETVMVRLSAVRLCVALLGENAPWSSVVGFARAVVPSFVASPSASTFCLSARILDSVGDSAAEVLDLFATLGAPLSGTVSAKVRAAAAELKASLYIYGRADPELLEDILQMAADEESVVQIGGLSAISRIIVSGAATDALVMFGVNFGMQGVAQAVSGGKWRSGEVGYDQFVFAAGVKLLATALRYAPAAALDTWRGVGFASESVPRLFSLWLESSVQRMVGNCALVCVEFTVACWRQGVAVMLVPMVLDALEISCNVDDVAMGFTALRRGISGGIAEISALDRSIPWAFRAVAGELVCLDGVDRCQRLKLQRRACEFLGEVAHCLGPGFPGQELWDVANRLPTNEAGPALEALAEFVRAGGSVPSGLVTRLGHFLPSDTDVHPGAIFLLRTVLRANVCPELGSDKCIQYLVDVAAAPPIGVFALVGAENAACALLEMALRERSLAAAFLPIVLNRLPLAGDVGEGSFVYSAILDLLSCSEDAGVRRVAATVFVASLQKPRWWQERAGMDTELRDRMEAFVSSVIL